MLTPICARRAVLLVMVLAAGCGDDRGLVPVAGRVTLDGDAMPDAGDLTFVPIEVATGYPLRPAKAEFGADGRYAARSFDPGDGLYPGRYQVLVACWRTPPTPDGPPPVSHIPIAYGSRATSLLEVEVPADASRVTYDIPLRGE